MQTDTFISPKRQTIALLSALAYGVLVSAAGLPPVLGLMGVGGGGGGPGAVTLGVFLTVNVVLPAGSLAVALYCPRKRVVFASVLLIFLGFWFVRMAFQEPRLWMWTPANIAAWTHPILVASMVVSMGLAMLAAIVRNAAGQVVAPPPDPWACERCGYDLRGARSSVCPECGKPASAVGAKAVVRSATDQP